MWHRSERRFAVSHVACSDGHAGVFRQGGGSVVSGVGALSIQSDQSALDIHKRVIPNTLPFRQH